MSEEAAEARELCSIALAWLHLRQGDIGRARRMFARLLGRAPGDAEALRGMERCRRLQAGGGKTMAEEKRLQVLRLLLARLTGQPAPESYGPAGEKTPGRLRRRQVLETLLERVREEVKAREAQPLPHEEV